MRRWEAMPIVSVKKAALVGSCMLCVQDMSGKVVVVQSSRTFELRMCMTCFNHIKRVVEASR